MTIEWAHNGSVELAYEHFGPAEGEPLLLIMGQLHQMVWWPDEFCAALGDRGFSVARFDNRDSGLSTHFTSERPEHVIASLFRGRVSTRRSPYTGTDLVADVLSVLDALDWRSAHLLGGSLGGIIAQGAALHAPHRVRSLTSLASGPGDQWWPTHLNFPMLLRLLRLPKPRTPEQEIEAMVRSMRLVNGPGHPFDDELGRRIATESLHRRRPDMSALQRQSGAGWSGGRLRDLRVPTLVLHGEADPIMRVSAGYATAKAVPGAKFVGYAGMGHFVPPALWEPIADEIRLLARQSSARHPMPGHSTHGRETADPVG